MKVLLHFKYMSLIFLIAVLYLISGCSNPTNSNNSSGTNITIKNNAFSPQTLTVTTGDEVTWTNKDSIDHTVSSGTPDVPTTAFDSGNIAPNGTYTVQFTIVRSYAYYCKIHPGMRGTIIVKAPSSGGGGNGGGGSGGGGGGGGGGGY